MASLALLRGLHVAATLSMLGTTGFLLWILPAAGDGKLVLPILVRWLRISGGLALILGAAWFVLESAEISNASTMSSLLAALPIVATRTRYGHTMLLRAGLLLLAVLAAGRSRYRPYLSMLVTGFALGLQGVIGHAGAAEDDELLASEWLHLLAAGLWLGALLPLWLTVGRLPSQSAAAVCERFSPVGLACVLMLVGTGLFQGLALIGSIPALIGTTYGQIALLKITLFLLALALAALNRLWLTGRLADRLSNARQQLRLSLVVETISGLVVILAAGFLASTSPGIHDQPVWPLSWQFSLDAVQEDADLRNEVILGASLIGLAATGLFIALVLRRFRIAMAAALVLLAVLVWRGSSFTLLMVPAYPTSFQTSPTDFAAISIVKGRALFQQNCVVCHGIEGRGDGPQAAKRRIKPADLTQPHLWAHPDGELFWWLTHGIDDPEGGLAMQGFPNLSAADRWALIDYVRAHNVGMTLAAGAPPAAPVPAPSMPVRCSGLSATEMRDLRGSFVQVISSDGESGEVLAAPQSGRNAVTLDLRSNQSQPEPGRCVAATEAARPAYAILTGVSPATFSGSELLIDANGWLAELRKANGATVHLATGAAFLQATGAHSRHH
jgi:putative copper export protein/mono/diheme cytochrome c family protein